MVFYTFRTWSKPKFTNKQTLLSNGLIIIFFSNIKFNNMNSKFKISLMICICMILQINYTFSQEIKNLINEPSFKVDYSFHGTYLKVIVQTNFSPSISFDVNQNRSIDNRIDRNYGLTSANELCAQFWIHEKLLTFCGQATGAKLNNSGNNYVFLLPYFEISSLKNGKFYINFSYWDGTNTIYYPNSRFKESYILDIITDKNYNELKICNLAINDKAACLRYIADFPNGLFVNDIKKEVEDIEIRLYDKAKSGFIAECDEYINDFPTGKYVNQIKTIKAERVKYKTALNGGISEYNLYLQAYPNGLYYSEILSLKSRRIIEIERQNKLKYNSNRAIWKIGNKLCLESLSGTICGTLISWNEDKSMFQFRVISGPDTRIEGEQIKPDAIIWITPNTNWHICLQDEIETSISQNEDPYKYWKLGKKICLKGTKGAWIFSYDVTIVGEIIQWNEDKSKVRIRIIDGANGTSYNNETLYNDKMIWDSPSGWKICQ